MTVQDLTPVEDVGDPSNIPVQTTTEVASVDDFGPSEGWEFKLAAKHPDFYAGLRTAGDLFPFGAYAFPSGRKEFDNASLLKQAGLLGLEAMAFLPGEWINKGLKLATRSVVNIPLAPIKKGLRLINVAEKDVEKASPALLDNLMRKLDEFVYRDPVQGLTKKYGLSELEAKAVSEGRTGIWAKTNVRSGATIEETTKNIGKLLKKDGTFQTRVLKDLAVWKKTPEEQRLAFYKHEWKRYFGKLIEKGDYTVDQLFAGEARKLFGEAAAKEMSLGSVSEEDFMKVLHDSLLNRGKILRHVDANWTSYIFPVRKIAGAWEKLYGTLTRLYLPMKDAFAGMRRKVLEDINKFHLIQASKGIGKITKKGIFKEAYSGSEWRAAGKLVRKLDSLQGAKAPQEIISKAFEDASPMVKKIVKSYQEWTDYMYAEHAKTQIVRAFQKLNPTSEGWDGFDTLMSPYGRRMNSYITEIFAASNNLAYDQKIKAFGKVLEKIQREAVSNPHWFQGADRDAFRGFIKDLSFRKGRATRGLPDYLDNYGARLYESGYGQYARKELSGPARNITPGFVRGRTQEVGVEATEDLGKMVGTRTRQQARDLIVNPLQPGWVDTMNTLPKNLKTYFGHYLSRLLGEASPADKKVAQFVNSIFGSNWTGQRVKDLAYTINDMVYLGGIGFKPFSALRNLLQPILLVPGDLGGIKDTVWLVKGYQRGLSGQGMNYLREIGAITEYAPDLLFQPQVTKFGKTLTLAGKEITTISMRKARDAGMWMFKLSDRLNRYVSGGAAMSKWEYYTKKILTEKGGFKLTDDTITRFVKKLNLNSRDPWIRNQIASKLRSYSREGFEEAKKVYVKDVVADTQFLYGVADSPVVNQVGGAVTKNALVFQSWWMNYGAELQKWLVRSGSVDEAAQRMFAWMVSSAVIGNILIPPIWGKQTAKRTVFAGPFPLSVDIPATWRPIRDGFNTIITAGEATIGLSDLNQVKSKMLATLKSSMIYMPAGTQMVNLARGASKEGFPGFMKEIVRYRPSKP